MDSIASQNTSLTIVYSTVYSDAFVREINRWPVNSPHKGPVTRKMFPFDDVIMHCDIGASSLGSPTKRDIRIIMREWHMKSRTSNLGSRFQTQGNMAEFYEGFGNVWLRSTICNARVGFIEPFLSFLSFPFSHCCENNGSLLNVTYIFGIGRRSLAVVTPVRYESD